MNSARHMLLTALGAAVLLTGCSGVNSGRWPTLAPRPGEISPLVPRTPLGACAGCGQDVLPAATGPAPVVAPVPAPADASARLDAIDAAVAAVEGAVPAQRGAFAKARATAAASPGNDDLSAAAEVQRSRLALMYVPLLSQSNALDTLADELVGKVGTDSLVARIAALRQRLIVLEADQLADGGL
jgi:hypothetical protein